MEKFNLKDRRLGVLCPISSLPGSHGIGDFGNSAYEFIDIIERMGITRWQILPIHPLGEGNSPYMPISSYAGEMLYIDISAYDNRVELCNVVDYDAVRKLKREVLYKAYLSFDENDEYQQFVRDNAWLDSYVLYTKEEKGFECFVQYLFFKQYNAMKKYANEKGIAIIGDVPIYVGYDSVDVFVYPHLFDLDKQGKMRYVSGASPDYFNPLGQVWNHPLYRYEEMALDHYSWWKKRIDYALTLYDFVRLDHFKGFVDYFVVPCGEQDATKGFYCKGPRYAFFNNVIKDYDRFIVEDLGNIDDKVKEIRDYYGFMSMEIFQFNTHNTKEHCVYYSGSHDNGMVVDYLDDQGICYDEFVCQIMENPASLVVLSIQDMLRLDSMCRMNIPGSALGNWTFKLKHLDDLNGCVSYFKDFILSSCRNMK